MNTSSLTTPILEAYLLGPPEFRRDGEILPLLVTRKTLSLLAFLLLHPRHTHSREKLATLFWGDVSDQQARHSLRSALANLRKELGGKLFLTDRETIQINPDVSIWVDALQFEKDAQAASKGEEIKDLQDTIALYRGDLLADFYDDWILRERDHYRSLYLELLLQMTHRLRSLSEYASAIDYAERILESDPANERAHQHLIFCRLANGDRGAALRQYEECRRVLQEELAVEPSPETTALYQWLRQAPVKAIEARITNLPIPLTSFIGRAREMARVKDMLARSRLVTLTGSGGCGKTRLAIQVASDLVDSFNDGVWWVDFAPLMDEALVPQTVAKVVGVREAQNIPISETLVNYLRRRKMLLVLDNCEHLVGGISRLVITLLSTCAELKILATSRETFDVPGETILRVPALTFPMSRHLSPGEKLEDYESARLLLERAVAVKPDFDFSEVNASAVAQICRRLDGIPLAIELAAARLKVLSIEQIAMRLDDRFSLLSTGGRVTLPRHQTLRAVMDWSYNLLSEQEQAFLCRLSVFVGGWTLEAAHAICADIVPPAGAIDVIASLLDKSLVETEETGGEARYRMLETMRQYGLERLREAGQLEATRHSHALFFAELAEKAERQLRGAETHAWIERLETEHDNFRAALEWSLAQESPELSLRFAGALGIFWRKRGYLSEGRTWLESMLARSKDAPPSLCARAMAPASWLERDLGNYERAAELQEESLRILRAAGDQFRLADILIQGGLLAVYQNEPQRAFTCFSECLALSEKLDYRWGRAMALVNLAHAALFNLQWDALARSRCELALELFNELDDETEQAHALIILGAGAHYEHDDARGRKQLEQAVAICRQAGDKRQLAWATTVLSQMIGRSCKIDEALSVAREGLRLAVELGEKTVVVFAIIFLALFLKRLGQVERSLRILSCGIAYGNSFGYRLSPYMWDAIHPELDAMRSILGEGAFTKGWAEGEVISFERALQDALEVCE